MGSYSKKSSGQPFEFSASLYNDLVDFASSLPGKNLAGSDGRPTAWILAVNTNDPDEDEADRRPIGRFAPVTLGESFFEINGSSSPDKVLQFEHQPLLSATFPACDSNKPWGITMDYIPPGGIGRVLVAGASPCRIKGPGGMRVASPDCENPGLLLAGQSGAKILWEVAPTGTEERLGLVLLGDSGDGIELCHAVIIAACNTNCGTYRVVRVRRTLGSQCDDCGSGSGSGSGGV